MEGRDRGIKKLGRKQSERQQRRRIAAQVKCFISDCSPVKGSLESEGTPVHPSPPVAEPSEPDSQYYIPGLVPDPLLLPGDPSHHLTDLSLVNSINLASDELEDDLPAIEESSDESGSEYISPDSYSDESCSNQLLDTASGSGSNFDLANPSVTFLREWSIKNRLTHTAVTDLLKWFSTNPNISNLPKDARTLLKTPRQVDLRIMGNGQFYYIGLQKKIKSIYTKYESSSNSNAFLYHLHFNIDGLPLHKSTKNCFWPILCKVANYPKEQPFAVAIYYGSGKPPLNDFFREFVNEVSELHQNYLQVDGKTIKIKCESFCCDTPARSYIKGTMAHNSYEGCDKCMVRGVYINRRMVFLNSSAPLRTDEEFIHQVYGNYHKEVSPLCNLGIGMVSSFPVDYMHSVCLGVMRKLLFLWRDGSRLYKLTGEKLEKLESLFKNLSTFWPVEFNRKPRSLKDLEHWKAIEFRQFLLYITPLLDDILTKQVFSNVMLLKFAMTILLSHDLNTNFNEYANNLLKLFVSHSIQIYGKQFCIYNVHSLIHLARDAKCFDTLNNINCFAFENYLGMLKKMLRKSHQCRGAGEERRARPRAGRRLRRGRCAVRGRGRPRVPRGARGHQRPVHACRIGQRGRAGLAGDFRHPTRRRCRRSRWQGYRLLE